jgi:hypothetical protein
VKDPFWRWFLVEGLQKRIERSDPQSIIWQCCQDLLSFLNTPEIFEIYLQNRFPDGDSIKRSITYTEKELISLPSFFISYFDSGGFVRLKQFKKGYSDKGSIRDRSKSRLDEGLDTQRGRMIYNFNLVNEEGVFVMESTERTLKEILLELHSESLESLLEFVRRKNRQMDLFQQQDMEKIQEILHNEGLSPEEKIERMMKGERTKKPKPKDSQGEHRAEEKKSLRIYQAGSDEDRKSQQNAWTSGGTKQPPS